MATWKELVSPKLHALLAPTPALHTSLTCIRVSETGTPKLRMAHSRLEAQGTEG